MLFSIHISGPQEVTLGVKHSALLLGVCFSQLLGVGGVFLCNLERAQLRIQAGHSLGLPWDGNQVEVTSPAWFYYLPSCFWKGATGSNNFSTWLEEVSSVWLKCDFVSSRCRRELVLLHLPQWNDDDLLQLMSCSQSWQVFLNFNRIFIKCSRQEFEPFV